jgi:Zn-dependent peptidase ImmA (M78 family)
MNITTQGTIFARLRGLVPQRLLRMAEAERLAELQANRFRELLGITTPELPTEAITELPRIFVTSECDMPVSGSAHWSNGRWIIAINAMEHPARQRFSLAHELKHVLDYTTRQRLYPDEPGLPASVKSERLADYFAGCLLMPKRHVKRLFGQHPGDLQTLADAFGVTPKAMHFRLAQLGLTQVTPRCGTPKALRPTSMYRRKIPIGSPRP